MSDAALIVRALRVDDADAWRILWLQYLAYHGMWPEDAPPDTWPRLMDPAHALEGIGAECDGQLVGFAHYVLHPHPWLRAPVCWLADVFTDPAERRRGVARALVDAVFTRAAQSGAAHVYGTTLESNGTSQALYDQVADRLPLVVYRHEL